MVVAQPPANCRKAPRGAKSKASLRSRSLPVVPMRIAILGTRGVPPAYGGFETFAAELGTRLVQRGHQVTVYCRRPSAFSPGSAWNGIRRIVLPAIPGKYFE